MPKHAVNDNAEIRSEKSLSGICSSNQLCSTLSNADAYTIIDCNAGLFSLRLRHWNFTLKAKLDDAVQRHASIDERIMEWGEPSAKETLNDGQIIYTWKLPWSDEQFLSAGNAYSIPHACTVVITTSSDNAVQSYKTDDC